MKRFIIIVGLSFSSLGIGIAGELSRLDSVASSMQTALKSNDISLASSLGSGFFEGSSVSAVPALPSPEDPRGPAEDRPHSRLSRIACRMARARFQAPPPNERLAFEDEAIGNRADNPNYPEKNGELSETGRALIETTKDLLPGYRATEKAIEQINKGLEQDIERASERDRYRTREWQKEQENQ